MILALWAGFALRGRPLRPYVAAWFLAVLLATVGEFSFSTLLDRYDLWADIMADHQQDFRLAQVIVRHALTPELTLLYLAYRPRSPLWVTIGSGVALGLLETLFVAIGAMTYDGWSPIYTALLYGTYLAIMGALFGSILRWPAWIHAGTFAFAWENFTDVLLHGVFGLWHNRLPGLSAPLGDKLFTLIHDLLFFVPLFLLLCGRISPKPERQALLLGAMLLVEWAALALGVTTYVSWSVPAHAIRQAVVILLAALYADWWQANGEKGSG